MKIQALAKLSLDRLPRLKYHLIKNPPDAATLGVVVRYAKRVAKDKRLLIWFGTVRLESPDWDAQMVHEIGVWVVALRNKGALCPRCEGPKQPKYRNHPTDKHRHILACPDCDTTNGAPLVTLPGRSESPRDSAFGEEGLGV